MATCYEDFVGLVKLFGWVGLLNWMVLGCSSDDADSYREENRETDKIGDTCGSWQEGGSSPVRVNVACGDGLTCQVPAQVVNPEGEAGNRYSICLPDGALSCELPPGSGCPGDLTCAAGFNIPDPGRCFVSCDLSRNCPGPFQTCLDQLCRVNLCPLVEEGQDGGADPDSYCPADARCDRGVCVPEA